MAQVETELETKSLPANAYQPLKEGELYVPLVPASASVPEVTWRAVLWGTLLCIIFSVASAYSALKVGQGMEAAIPISILAIGLARVYRRRSTVLENVIITGIGAASGSVVAGAVFTFRRSTSSTSIRIPCRPSSSAWPAAAWAFSFSFRCAATSCASSTASCPFPKPRPSPKCWSPAKKAARRPSCCSRPPCIAAVYDFFVTTFHVWKEYLNFQFVPVMRALADRARMVFNFDAIGFILGLGYVMGLRIAMIFCAGGVLVNFVLVPMIWFFGSHMGDVAVYPAAIPISHMTAAEIYRNYVRFIGVGAIAAAGIVGILKSLRVVAGSFGIALHAFRHGEAAAYGAHRPRHSDHRHSSRRHRRAPSPWPSSSDDCMSPGPCWRWAWC